MNVPIDLSNSDATIQEATSEDGWGYFDLVGVGSHTLLINQTGNGSVIESMSNVGPNSDVRIVANDGEVFLGAKDYYSGGQFRYEDTDNLQSLSIEANSNARVYIDKDLLDHVDGNISITFGGEVQNQHVLITLPDSDMGSELPRDIDVYGMGENGQISVGSFVSPGGGVNRDALSYDSENQILHLSLQYPEITFNIHDVPPADAEQFMSDVSAYVDPESGLRFQLPARGPVCFCQGTLIDTVSGAIPINKLQIGDRIVGRSGIREVKWIGWRVYDAESLRTTGRRQTIMPIRIRASAIADGIPSRDLLVSPWHHVYVEGLLVRAADLINDITIVQETNMSEVSYWHIELDQFDVVLAHGLYSESWADGGNRDFFQNVDVRSLRPEDQMRRRASRPGFDHLIVHNGKKLASIQYRTLKRAKACLSETDLSAKAA